MVVNILTNELKKKLANLVVYESQKKSKSCFISKNLYTLVLSNTIDLPSEFCCNFRINFFLVLPFNIFYHKYQKNLRLHNFGLI
ncbi:hypothetical protein BpHYR1_004857 [Brachionus plicatilis]|uniref:Uncharacterized protein n=1 Tax=Brachionus plicatilis TaxID=10195 RepID=A0A3M7SYT7_BRAPC|nr:hypothetical protein BpHYR1_004857 [Brachionus plicatilis]